MQYDYERAAAIINDFRDLVMEIKSIDNACQTEIKENVRLIILKTGAHGPKFAD